MPTLDEDILPRPIRIQQGYKLLTSHHLAIADIISAVEFDGTGDYLATGDKGGRVVLFERNEGVRWLLHDKDACSIKQRSDACVRVSL